MIDDKEDFNGNAQVKVVISEKLGIGNEFESVSSGVRGIHLPYIYEKEFNLYDKESDTMRIPLMVTYKVWQCKEVQIMDETVATVEGGEKVGSSLGRSPRSPCDSDHSEFEIVNHGSYNSDGRSEESGIPVVRAKVLWNDVKPQDSDITAVKSAGSLNFKEPESIIAPIIIDDKFLRRFKVSTEFAEDVDEPCVPKIDLKESECLDFLFSLKRPKRPFEWEQFEPLNTLNEDHKSSKRDKAVQSLLKSEKSNELQQPVSDRTLTFSEKAKEAVEAVASAQQLLTDPASQLGSWFQGSAFGKSKWSPLESVSTNQESKHFKNANAPVTSNQNLILIADKDDQGNIVNPREVLLTDEEVAILNNSDLATDWDYECGLSNYLGYCREKRLVAKLLAPLPPATGFALDEDEPTESEGLIPLDRIGNMTKKEIEAIETNVKISQMVNNIFPEKKEDLSSINWVKMKNSPEHIKDKNAKLMAQKTNLSNFYELLYIADYWGSKQQMDMVIKDFLMKQKFEQLFESPGWKNLKDHCTLYSKITEQMLTEAMNLAGTSASSTNKQ